jgi:hypothetical protein
MQDPGVTYNKAGILAPDFFMSIAKSLLQDDAGVLTSGDRCIFFAYTFCKYSGISCIASPRRSRPAKLPPMGAAGETVEIDKSAVKRGVSVDVGNDFFVQLLDTITTG